MKEGLKVKKEGKGVDSWENLFQRGEMRRKVKQQSRLFYLRRNSAVADIYRGKTPDPFLSSKARLDGPVGHHVFRHF
jgi:hypothetical protein